MTRLRYNGLTNTLGGSLSGGATAITFATALTHAGGTAVPTIGGGDYIPLALLDADTGVLEEIVHLTAYTSGATTGTISRAQEGTTGVTHAGGDLVVHSPMVDDISAASDASTSVKGIVELATRAETQARASSTLGVTPDGLDAALDDVLTAYVAADSAVLSAAAGFVGNLATLLTADKDSAVDAINELVTAIAALAPTPDASTTVKGKVELATDTETSGLTDATRAVTPHGLAAAATAEGWGTGGGGGGHPTGLLYRFVGDASITPPAAGEIAQAPSGSGIWVHAEDFDGNNWTDLFTALSAVASGFSVFHLQDDGGQHVMGHWDVPADQGSDVWAFGTYNVTDLLAVFAVSGAVYLLL